MANIFGTAAPTLSGASFTDTGPISFWTSVTSTAAASMTAVRYYVANTALGTDNPTATVYVWDSTSSATALATKSFTVQATVGWQVITLTTPVAMVANRPYIVVVDFVGAIHYGAKTSETFPITNGTLTANTAAFRAGTGHEGYPGTSGATTNYFVDLETAAGGSVVTLSATSGHLATVGESVAIAATAASGSGTKTYAWSSTGTAGAFGSTTSATTTWTPSAAGVATLSCTVTDTSGNATATTAVTAIANSPSQTVTTTGTVTLLGGAASAQAALVDTDPATGIDAASGATITSVLGVVYKPASGGLPVVLTGSISGGGASASYSVQLQENTTGSTWVNVGAAQTATLGASDAAVTVTIPQTALDAALSASFGTSGKLRLVLTAAAA